MIAKYVRDPAREVSPPGMSIKYLGRKARQGGYELPQGASWIPDCFTLARKRESLPLADEYIQILDPVTDVGGAVEAEA